MDLKNLLTFLRKIESLNLDYMITGSVASILYGKPRLTQDMDVVVIAAEEVSVAPPEYVILKKLAYYKEGGSQKHIEDIKGMLEVSGNQIKISFIEKWAFKSGLSNSWADVLQ